VRLRLIDSGKRQISAMARFDSVILYQNVKGNMSTLMLKVEGLAGSSVEECAREILELSKKLDVGVELSFNGTLMFTWPHMTEEEILSYFKRKR
jgi:hypothetical protein